jgi:3-methyl-2-oxobutanoate hydroxymethyltransferase
MKGLGKIAVLTAYDFYHAKVLDKAGIDIILVGDSLGMVFSGYKNTLPVRVEDIFYHCSAVSRGVQEALVVADMPFLSYQVDNASALINCGRFIKEGVAQAVKIEGGNPETCSRVECLVQAGVPVLAHIGLTPQLINTMGGYRVQGKSKESADALKESALRLQDAGAFGMVLEAMPKDVAREITASLAIPTIGIGAGPSCDGQILVISDILGMFDEFKPKFARRYADLGTEIKKAVGAYIDDVRLGRFPDESETY